MMERLMIVGSRKSSLAVAQAKLVMDDIARKCPELALTLITMKTTGDKILDRPLDEIGGKGLFVKELDQALRSGKCDLCVHSCKDLPMECPEDLPLVGFSAREDVRDVLVLPEGASGIDFSKPIGTSSRRRLLQAKALYPQATFASVRGNLQTRLKKLDDGEYGALILAAAGLKRMGLMHRISRFFSVDEMLPAAGQGILALQGRKGEDYEILSGVTDETAFLEVTCERAFVAALGGGCSAPVAVLAALRPDGTMHVKGWYEDQTTGEIHAGSMTEPVRMPADAARLGRCLAHSLGVPAGKVWLVGAGPGDDGLITLKGAEVLKSADVVVVDALVSPGILLKIPREAKVIDAGKRSGAHTIPQEEMNTILLDEALQGKRVVRLKGGDPFVFGRGGEELELLAKHHIPFEVVPGVTSAFAVPAYNGIPVTHRDFCSSVHVITGHRRADGGRPIAYDALAATGGTLLFLMGLSELEEICSGLIKSGMSPDTPAAVLSQGTTAHQRRLVSTLATLPKEALAAQMAAPAVIVVGEVCTLADDFSWAEARPLGGCRVLVTRPSERSSEMARKLRSRGAQVLEIPAITIKPVSDMAPLQEGIAAILAHQIDWIVFTSMAGVDLFFDTFFETCDVRSLAGVRFAAIGRSTAAGIRKRGLMVDLVPDVYDADTLGRELAEVCKGGEHLLLPRARIGSKALNERLLERGDLTVTEIALYDTLYELSPLVNEKRLLENGEIDFAVFTSASCVRGLIAAVGEMDYSLVQAVCIGKQTAAEAEKAGMKIFIAREATMDSVVEAVEEAYRREN